MTGARPDSVFNPVGHWPWMASIGYYNEEDEWVHQCGATLITSNHFLTAAHCVANQTNQIIHVGEWNYTNPKNLLSGIDLPIRGIKIHHNYTRRVAYYDVAIIKTDAIQFSNDVRAVCLPKTSGANRDYFSVDLLGWGSSEIHGKASKVLQRVSLTIFPNEYCNNTHWTLDERRDRIKQVVPELFPSHLICSGVKTGVQGACRGDSGGPLQFYNVSNFRFYQVAIVHGSAASNCGDPSMPSVYVRLDDPEILDFVQSAISKEENIQQDFNERQSNNEEEPKKDQDTHDEEVEWHLTFEPVELRIREESMHLYHWGTAE